MAEVPLTGWYAAYVVVAVVVFLVVALVAALLQYARRIGKQTLQITEALDEVRLRTLPLSDMGTVASGLNQAAESLARTREQREAR